MQSTNRPHSNVEAHTNICTMTYILIERKQLNFSLCYTSVANLSTRPPQATLWFSMLAPPPDRMEVSRLCVCLFGMASPPTSVLSYGTCLVIFINYLRFSSLARLGSGVHLNSILMGCYISSTPLVLFEMEVG